MGLEELTHARQVSAREAKGARIALCDGTRQFCDDAIVPISAGQLPADVLADLPVEGDEFGLDGLVGAVFGGGDEGRTSAKAESDCERRESGTLRRVTALAMFLIPRKGSINQRFKKFLRCLLEPDITISNSIKLSHDALPARLLFHRRPTNL